ncbi:MAG: hypothetical protein AAGF83_24820 [Cyanobacteria bacterium P01_G01_bin.67]
MFELIRGIIFLFTGVFALYWFMSDISAWQKLSEKYRTESKLPRTFLITENQRIIFKRENKNGSAAFANLGIGVSDDGLYFSQPSMSIDPLNRFPALLIPWSDIAYRKVAAANYSAEYYTFYLGNPRIVRFSLNGETINKLEQDYGEPIFRNKLGEPE